MFRMKLNPVSRPLHSDSASAQKVILRFGCGLAVLILVVGWFAWHGKRRVEETETGPVLLSLKKIGQLHTAQMNFQQVLHQDSDQQPEGWIKGVPGAAEITHWATHNHALVTADGSVEAGIDLSRLSEKDVTRVPQADGTTLLRVHLPPVQIYTPNVKVRVESAESGPFWRDENIVPKAEAEARRRFLEAAEQQNMRAHAQENAIETLTQMQRALGNTRVEFSF